MLVQLLIIQIIAFTALIFLLRVLFYRNLNSALSRLKELQEQALAKEANLQEELMRAKRERELQLEKGKKEARELVEQARRQAEDVRKGLEEEAKREKEKIIGDGAFELDKRRQKIAKEIEERAVSTALEMIKCVLTEKGEENLQYGLLDELLAEIKKLDKRSFSVSAGEARVITALPLKSKEKSELEALLSEKTGKKVSLAEEVREEIIAGLIVRIGEFVIDGSLRNKLQKAIPLIRK